MSNKIKRMDIKEFHEKGFLQEVNRRFFHPLGLGLEVVIEDDGNIRLGGIWDYRDDPEGMFFGSDNPDIKKERIKFIDDLINLKIEARQNSKDGKVNEHGVQIFDS